MRMLIFFCLTVVTLGACSKNLTPFNERMVDEMDWTDDDLKRIQFYLSKDIVLRREARQGDASIREGKIKIVNGKKVEEIIFEKGTPGVFIFSPKRDHVAVAFEPGDDRYLMFGPNPKYHDRFVLLAKDWKKNHGLITYDSKVYKTSSESAFAALMVDLEKARKASVKSRTARGRTVR